MQAPEIYGSSYVQAYHASTRLEGSRSSKKIDLRAIFYCELCVCAAVLLDFIFLQESIHFSVVLHAAVQHVQLILLQVFDFAQFDFEYFKTNINNICRHHFYAVYQHIVDRHLSMSPIRK
jgi:hypothetical protein